MCGISGIFSIDSSKINFYEQSSALKSFSLHQAHRGPDENNICIMDNVCLIHNRLSIVDHVGGQQPMQLIEGVVLVYGFVQATEPQTRKQFFQISINSR